MTIGITQVANPQVVTAPGASSTASTSRSCTAGRNYFVSVCQIRGSSTNPGLPTLAGWGQTWTEVEDIIWSPSGTNRRRSTLFHCRSDATTSGALTASYTGQPSIVAFIIIEVTGASATGYVDANTRSGAVTATQNTLDEDAVTMPSPASTDNRLLAIVSGNSNFSATGRMELASDTGGDADWTSFTSAGSGSAPTNGHVAGWLNAAPATDLTPGFFQNTTNVAIGMICVEIEAETAPPPSSNVGFWGVIATTLGTVIVAGYGITPYGTGPYGNS